MRGRMDRDNGEMYYGCLGRYAFVLSAVMIEPCGGKKQFAKG